MKKIVSALLVLAIMLSMTACGGKEPTIASVLDFPLAADSISECKKFLKECGYEVESATDDRITFTGGDWTGYASLGFPAAVTLSYYQYQSKSSFEDTLKAVQAELKAVCGEPYSTDTNTMLQATTEYYAYNGKVVHVFISHGSMESIDITIMTSF